MIRAYLFWAIVLAGSITGFFRPFRGMLWYLLITHACLVGFLYGGWEGSYGALLAGGIMTGYVLRERSAIPLRELKLMLGFWLCMSLATLWAYDPTLSYPLLSQNSRMFVIVLILAAMTNTEERARDCLLAAAAAIGFLGVKGAMDMVFSGASSTMQGPGFLADENDYALALVIGVSLLFVMAQDRSLTRRRVWALRAAGLACVMTIVGTRSRGGLVGLAASGMLLAIFSRRKLLGIGLILVLGILLWEIAPSEAKARYLTIQTAADSDRSAQGRLEAWETGLNMMRAHPWFGVGPRNFVPVFPSYSGYEPRAPHNIFVMVGAEDGLPALALYITMWFGMIGRLLLLRRRLLRRDPNSKMAVYCLAVSLGLASFIVPGMFNNMYCYDLPFSLIGIGAGIAAMVQKQLLAEAPVPQFRMHPGVLAKTGLPSSR